MKDVFGIPTKVGDTILYIYDSKFLTGKIIEYGSVPEYVTYGDITVESGELQTFIRNGNFIRINDIIENNPQYFI